MRQDLGRETFDFTWIIQNPAISSFAVNGPSVTVGAPRENLTRARFELGWIPSPASRTPAFTISSLPGTVLSAPRRRYFGGPSRTGRTSTVLVRANGIRAAMAMASSRSLTSMSM